MNNRRVLLLSISVLVAIGLMSGAILWPNSSQPPEAPSPPLPPCIGPARCTTAEIAPTPRPDSIVAPTVTPTTPPAAEIAQAHLLCQTYIDREPDDSPLTIIQVSDMYPGLYRNRAPRLRGLIQRLTSSPVNFDGCGGTSGIARELDTAVSTGQVEQGRIRFELDSAQQRQPYARAWVIMAADNTVNLERDDIPIGRIEAVYTNSNRNSIDIYAGETIADWSYRDIEGRLPITRFTRFTRINNEVRQIHFDYESKDNERVRATQLLATSFNVNNQIEHITIIDTSTVVALRVIGVLLDPSPKAESDESSNNFEPICLSALPPENFYGSTEREPNEFFLQFNRDNATYSASIDRSSKDNILLDCDTTDRGLLSNNAPASLLPPENIPFYLDKILEVRSDRRGSNPYVTMSIDLPVAFLKDKRDKTGYLYLILHARNVCLRSDALVGDPVVGQVRVNNEKSIDLIVGENIRQGRTNFKICGDNNAFMGLSSVYGDVQVLPGMAVPAVPSDETEGMHAELWLDILKFKLPEVSSDTVKLTVSVRNRMVGSNDTENLFITLYAVTVGWE